MDMHITERSRPAENLYLPVLSLGRSKNEPIEHFAENVLRVDLFRETWPNETKEKIVRKHKDTPNDISIQYLIELGEGVWLTRE